MTEFIMPSSTEELTVEQLHNLIAQHQAEVNNRYKLLFDLYDNEAPILSQESKADFKPDNRLTVNFAKYIVDTFNGFFMGVPIKTTHDNEKVAAYVEMIQQYNDQDDNNAELSKLASIFGRSIELLFVDENAKAGITYIDPREAFIVYDDSIRKRRLFGIRYFKNHGGEIEGSYSTKSHIYYFRDTPEGYVIDQEIKEHYFGDVPMIECVENEEKRGAFEAVYRLINAYNKALSEKANDVDYFADAYMKILGQELDETTIKKLRDSRIINMKGEGVDKLIVEFMEKPSADQTQENLIDRLEKLIFLVSMVANINDESFGTASGISLQYKLQAMNNLAKVKERKFTSLMNQRWKLIASLPNTPMSEDDWIGLEYQFTRNIPANVVEESQVAQALQGIVSNETLLKVLSVVDNAKEEIARMEAERETRLSMFPASFGATELTDGPEE